MRLLRGIGRLLGQRMMGLRAVTPARTRPAIAPAHTHALAPVRERLRSEAGETISEVLVGVVIVGRPAGTFVVNTQSSNPDNDAEATYAFTHYQLPLVEQAREGERA